MTMTKGVRSLCVLLCVLSLAGWVAANVADTAPNVDQFMREYDGWLAASEAEAQAVRLSSPSNTRLALFGDPLQLQSNSPALKKAAPRVSDPFRFLQTSVSTTPRSSDETTKSYEKLKHFVSQVFDRVKAEQDIGDLEAKQQVILCRRNEANQRDKTLAQLELVNQLNTTLVKATSLLTELPTIITEKSATMSSERAAIFKAKAKLARIVEERTEEKKNFLSRQQALNNQIAAMDAVLDNIKKMPIEVKGEKAPKFEDKDDKAPTPKVASPFSFAAIQATTPRVSQAKTEGDGALSKDLQELASLGIVVSATTANAMASSAAPPQPPSQVATAPVAKKAETSQKKSEDQEDHFAQLQSSLSAEIDRALGRSGAGSALVEDQDLSADREVDSIEQQLQSAMQDGRSESRQKALKAKEEAEKSIQRLQKLTAAGAPRVSAPAATAAQKQAEAKALLHLSDQEMANENELLAQYNAANQNNAITGEEEAPGLLEIFSAPKPTDDKKKKKDDDDDDDDDDDKKKKKKNELKEKENQLGEDEEELKLSEDENREGDVELHAVKPKAKVDELTGVEDDLKVPDLSNAKEEANATKKEEPKSKEPPKKVVLTSASVKKLQAIYAKVTALKAVISKSLLNVVKGEVENMKSFFAKKKLARAQYDLHLTEFLKARKQLHKAQKRLAKAKVRAHRSGKGVKYNMPLFIIMKQQLKTLKKACRELEAQFAEQSEHRAKSINTTAAILKVIQDRIDGKSEPEKPEDDLTREPLPPTSIHTGKRNFSTCWDLLQAGYNVSGIYTLHDLRGHKTFQAYCDQRTNKGGWMLAFKQSDFASGSVKFNESLLGAQPLLHTKFNQSTLFSIMDYGNPKELLFRASKHSNWFTTPSFKKAYQYWEIKPTDRYCFYRPMHDTKTFELSPDWHGLEMWSDADIQLMDSFHPDISAVTVGRFYTLQKAPQCMEPHCSDQRHGRFRGKCQDGSKGEGNWMIFTR